MKLTPLLVPSGVVTVICTVPVPAGASAVILVADTTVNEADGVPPKATAVAPVKPVPVSVTTVPAAPEEGLRVVMTGAAAAADGRMV
ncbi:hypothetical protein GCM10015535_00090 [Streptomyces gelaticus]|uniref:Uncharacterized protein n=1 Tax=Streptomyces gelaticus TaxID=285446 RepID=A0ABQ2VPV6_9ACTN|nr:hypothetical protein GCM10015535_00090 [Streptomyces gelaticus]